MPRIQFTLNPNKEKERVILELLSTFYKDTESIKEILYNYALTQNVQIERFEHTGQIEPKKTTQIEQKEQFEKIESRSSDFSINLSSIEDEEVIVSLDEKEEDPNDNAMKYLLNNFNS